MYHNSFRRRTIKPNFVYHLQVHLQTKTSTPPLVMKPNWDLLPFKRNLGTSTWRTIQTLVGSGPLYPAIANIYYRLPWGYNLFATWYSRSSIVRYPSEKKLNKTVDKTQEFYVYHLPYVVRILGFIFLVILKGSTSFET